jgi:hypothetical protein
VSKVVLKTAMRRFDALFEDCIASGARLFVENRILGGSIPFNTILQDDMREEHSMVNKAIEPLILDLLEWVEKGERSYEEVMAAWRTSCPRLPVWEEANDRGFVMADEENGRRIIRITPLGRALLRQRKGNSKSPEVPHR